MKIMDVLLAPWALRSDRLEEIQALYLAHTRREKVDLKAWEAATGRGAGSERDPYQIQDGVAIIPLQGVLTKAPSAWNRICGMTSTAQAATDLQTALEDSRVTSILLWIDSPGGMVDGTQELAQAVFAARGQKSIVALADGCMCSAAYWVGSAAEQIYITSDCAETGSIGVVATHTDVSQAEARYGQKTTEITAGRYKRIASQYAPLSEDGRAVIQAQVDHIYSVFVEAVATHRGVSVETVLNNMADGRVFLGRQAIEAGLVDGVSTMADLIAELALGRTPNPAGAGAALPPATPSQEDPMSITREALAAMEGGPDLINTLISEGKAEGSAAQLARVNGCLDAAVPGYEKLATQLALDGTTTPGACALAVLQAQKKDQAAALKAHTEGGPAVPAGSDDPERIDAAVAAQKAEEEKAKASDPKAQWDASADLRAEFGGNFEAYEAYVKRSASGQARVLNRTKPAE